MKRVIVFVLLLVCLGPPHLWAKTPTAPSVEEARWEHRILVTCGSPLRHAPLPLAKAMINQIDWPEFEERDLFLVDLQNDYQLKFHIPHEEQGTTLSLTDKTMWQAYHDLARCVPGSQNLTLIGKDGGVKQRWTEAPTLQVIFDIIDAMPMRMREMRRQQD